MYNMNISLFITLRFPYKPSLLIESSCFEHPRWFYGPPMTWGNIWNRNKPYCVFGMQALSNGLRDPEATQIYLYI